MELFFIGKALICRIEFKYLICPIKDVRPLKDVIVQSLVIIVDFFI